MAQSQELTILHFNDVYHISNTNLIARFATVLANPDSYIPPSSSSRSKSRVNGDDKNTLRIFSGDAFSPSLEAAVLRGEHMAPVLDSLDIDAACYGNHDFDFGETRLVELAQQQTRFPWLLANAVSDGNCRLLAGAREYLVKEVAGCRIGFFGLAGTDWPSNCQHLPEHTTILDPSTVAKKIASHLRLSERCDLVIAITHMRLVDDLAVANATLSGAEKVDVLLGGHDHHIVRRAAGDDNPDPDTIQSGCDDDDDVANLSNFTGDVRVVKSGSDWRGLSVLRLNVERDRQKKAFISNTALQQIIDLEKLPNYNSIPPSPQVLSTLKTIHAKIQKNVQQPLLHTAVPLEGRSRLVRREETNLGNMLADATRAFYNCDITLVNSGGIRCDRVIVECTSKDNAPPLCIRDVIEICPFDNAFIVKRVSGRVLVEALENSVSNAYADGRFLQLSGSLSITIDWTRPEGQRVCAVSFSRAQDEAPPQPLEKDTVYTVAMAAFIGSGFDGYSCFRDTETVVGAEAAVTDTNLLLEMFKTRADDAGRSDSGIVDEHTSGIRRARRAVIRQFHTDGLPVVAPVVEGRIAVVAEYSEGVVY